METTRRPANETMQEAGLFETLILPHAESLYGQAYQLTRNAPDAEDLVQDTILRAYSRFGSFRADGSPKAWLHTIMRNLFINTYRKKNREPRQISFQALDEPGTEAALRPTVASPERLVLGRMEEAALLRAVRHLPEEYRSVVILADVEGLSYQQIADRLGIPVGTVRSRLSRGRKRVQRALFSWRGSESNLVPA